MPPTPGLTATVRAQVGPADTARALGSGDVEVLGTPRLVALAEAATVAAVAGALPAGCTSVGSRIEVDHLAPSMPGAIVLAVAELTEVDGRRLTFDVTVTHGERLIGRARVIRVVVDRDRFAGAPADPGSARGP